MKKSTILLCLRGFLYYKIDIDAISRHDISIFASFIMSIIFTQIYLETISITINEIMLGAYPRWVENYIKSIVRVYLFLGLVNIILSKAIIFGFSKKLYHEVIIKHLYKDIIWHFKHFLRHSYLHDSIEKNIIFMLCVSVPLFIHFLILYIRTAQQKDGQAPRATNRRGRKIDKPTGITNRRRQNKNHRWLVGSATKLVAYRTRPGPMIKVSCSAN